MLCYVMLCYAILYYVAGKRPVRRLRPRVPQGVLSDRQRWILMNALSSELAKLDSIS